ncbi:ATP-grasp domain-containing protein [Aureivirga marina]|uniref:ATP-grasp domain-containing protein n=1 Tax=Aureivirga marina TaxID=1182451 RepID=UPI0018C9C399|nr:ATP-grasp domain-containing protein [Aureivirga marina]
MKAYIQTDKDGDYFNVNAFVAATGFKSLGFEIVKYVDVSETNEKDKEAIFVGGIGNFRKQLQNLHIEIPKEIEYPKELESFLNRKIWKSNLEKEIQKETTGIFIKPTKTKLFTGKVIHQFKDYIGLQFQDEVDILCSEVIEIATEWRCFIRYKEILDIRYYRGDWDQKLDVSIIKNAISKYDSQPASYSLDFGVDKKGNHFLIEVNDGHSLGTYGIGAISYAKFLSARWSELTNTEDYLRF